MSLQHVRNKVVKIQSGRGPLQEQELTIASYKPLVTTEFGDGIGANSFWHMTVP